MTSSPDRVAGDTFTGVTLGARYRLDALIGRGGMASVYRGEDLVLGRPVAVKVFAEAAEGIDDAGRRKSETGLLASLSHHALVRLYDAAQDPTTGREFLVMELVDGTDLRQALRRGPLSAADSAGLLADLAEALHVIHERGIVHRDVKPANVLLEPAHMPSRTWNAKLADFGIARLIDDARLTSTGMLIGTPGYLSPEQVTGTAPGAPADIYSLGLLALEARTGAAVFPGSAVEAATARLARDPEVPAELGSDWVALLRAMTAREPGDRPTALEVAMAASTLDTSADASDSATAPTIAFSQATEPATEAMAAPAATDAATGVLADASGPTAATRVLPTADRAFFPVPEAAERDGTAGRATAERSDVDGWRRWKRPAIAISLLVAVLAVVAGVLFSSLGNPTEAAPSEPLPAVPGELGVHLQQLDEAVTG